MIYTALLALLTSPNLLTNGFFNFFHFFPDKTCSRDSLPSYKTQTHGLDPALSRPLMEMKRIRRPPPPPTALEDPSASRGLVKRLAGPWPAARLAVAAVSVLFVLSLMWASGGAAVDRLRRASNFEAPTPKQENGSYTSSTLKDKFLGGLLTSGFDEASCLSRDQSTLYHKPLSGLPSPYLVERLRNYEALHKRCGPSTESYRIAVDQLKSRRSMENKECNYVVWISYSGLGNRILTLASVFLYALLTNRVLLVDRGADMGDLFCEPFPETSWLLPLDFPLNQFNSFDINSPESYGNMLNNKVINSGDGALRNSLPAYVYLHLAHDYGDLDKLFFCDEDQNVVQKIPWLVLRSDNYFVPSLFLMPAYEEELHRLFPKRDTVFHYLGRYLFHPTNSVWGLVTRYYLAYLAKADEKIGIQIRVFDTGPGPFQHVLDQIIACFLKGNLLPDVSHQVPIIYDANVKSKAVLMTSLNSGYFEKIRNMYWEQPTANGEIIGVYQPSHEGYQQTEKEMHNMKAWAEMYLLSMTDVLVTSAWSTFGYVAQGLGGIKPWILFKPENQTAPDPPCRRAMSMEPCFHAPPFYDCKAKKGIDTGELVPHVRHCEDMSWGLKLVDQNEW